MRLSISLLQVHLIPKVKIHSLVLKYHPHAQLINSIYRFLDLKIGSAEVEKNINDYYMANPTRQIPLMFSEGQINIVSPHLRCAIKKKHVKVFHVLLLR